MVATVVGVSFTDNDWEYELQHTLDIIGLVDAAGVTNLNVVAKVAGDAPPSLRVSLNSYEPGSKINGKGSLVTFPDLELTRARPGEVKAPLPANATAYRGSI